jgi:hypothetical protein
MDPPRINQLIHGAFKVCYESHHMNTAYEVSWSSHLQQRQMRRIENPEANCELISSLVPGTKYNICVRSDNSCEETCRPMTLGRTPKPPTCVVEACDPVKVKCECDDASTRAVTSYQVQVQKVVSNLWVTYPDCGSIGGPHLNCEIPHSWLANNTGHAEGEAITIRAVGTNAYGQGTWSSVMNTEYISTPVKLATVSVSHNFRHISWSYCGAAKCTYAVEIISPIINPPHLRKFEGITDLSYTLPQSYDNQHYQYQVTSSNVCNSVSAGITCHPVLPAPVFSESCPIKVAM